MNKLKNQQLISDSSEKGVHYPQVSERQVKTENHNLLERNLQGANARGGKNAIDELLETQCGQV